MSPVVRFLLIALVVTGSVVAGYVFWSPDPLTHTTTPIASPEAPSEPENVFNADFFTLDNGMEIVVIPNHRAPVVTHMVWYKVGAADEPVGKSGIAHFLEHLMFKGSTYLDADGIQQTLEPGTFSHIIKSIGGRDNAFTSQDYTAYFQSVPAQYLERVMRMEAGRMHGLLLDEAEVLSERDVILEERSQRTDNNPQAQLYEQLNATLFPNHPYGTPIIGWAHEMAALSLDDARAMYDLYYAPNNAILIVSGDVTGVQVLEMARGIYGPLERRDTPVRNRPKPPPLPGNVSVIMEDEAVHQPTVIVSTRAPSSRQSDADSLALEVLSEIMGGGSTSRLYQSLVVRQKIATSAGMSYSGQSFDEGDISVYGTPAAGTPPENVHAALMSAIQDLVDGGLDEGELSAAITRMQDQAVFARDSLSGPAMIIGRALASGNSLEAVETWPSRIAGVSAEDVIRVAKMYLIDATARRVPLVSGYLLPVPIDEVEVSPVTSVAPISEGAAQ